ncbi:hypothetical protein [Psychromonas aquimarina]|uniref:hypothetical protein n=1 Tax=Psychromonas aquimarina TaxID=444919 RepID=UPI00048B7156|nr:hypothetical protein [Psychromonas aquimarina]
MKKNRLVNKKVSRKKYRSNSQAVITKRKKSFHSLYWVNLFLTTVIFVLFLNTGDIGLALIAAGFTFFLPLLLWAMKEVIPPQIISKALLKKFYLAQ